MPGLDDLLASAPAKPQGTSALDALLDPQATPAPDPEKEKGVITPVLAAVNRGIIKPAQSIAYTASGIMENVAGSAADLMSPLVSSASVDQALSRAASRWTKPMQETDAPITKELGDRMQKTDAYFGEIVRNPAAITNKDGSINWSSLNPVKNPWFYANMVAENGPMLAVQWASGWKAYDAALAAGLPEVEAARRAAFVSSRLEGTQIGAEQFKEATDKGLSPGAAALSAVSVAVPSVWISSGLPGAKGFLGKLEEKGVKSGMKHAAAKVAAEGVEGLYFKGAAKAGKIAGLKGRAARAAIGSLSEGTEELGQEEVAMAVQSTYDKDAYKNATERRVSNFLGGAVLGGPVGLMTGPSGPSAHVNAPSAPAAPEPTVAPQAPPQEPLVSPGVPQLAYAPRPTLSTTTMQTPWQEGVTPVAPGIGPVSGFPVVAASPRGLIPPRPMPGPEPYNETAMEAYSVRNQLAAAEADLAKFPHVPAKQALVARLRGDLQRLQLPTGVVGPVAPATQDVDSAKAALSMLPWDPARQQEVKAAESASTQSPVPPPTRSFDPAAFASNLQGLTQRLAPRTHGLPDRFGMDRADGGPYLQSAGLVPSERLQALATGAVPLLEAPSTWHRVRPEGKEAPAVQADPASPETVTEPSAVSQAAPAEPSPAPAAITPEFLQAELAKRTGGPMTLKYAEHLHDAITNFNYNDTLDPSNKTSRLLFTELTGVKLPASIKGTKSALEMAKKRGPAEAQAPAQPKPQEKAPAPPSPAPPPTQADPTTKDLMDTLQAQGKLEVIPVAGKPKAASQETAPEPQGDNGAQQQAPSSEEKRPYHVTEDGGRRFSIREGGETITLPPTRSDLIERFDAAKLAHDQRQERIRDLTHLPDSQRATLHQQAGAEFAQEKLRIRDALRTEGERIPGQAEPPASPAPAGNNPEIPESSSTPSRFIVESVSEALSLGKTISKSDLAEWATKAYGGTDADGKWSWATATDALEAGINEYLMSAHPRLPDSPGALSRMVDQVEETLSRIPTQTVRDLEKAAAQQFSTPEHYSLAAMWVSGVKPGDVFLEPSAGTGNIAMWARVAGADVHVNEITQRRIEILEGMFGKDAVTRFDARQLRARMPNLRPDVVVMNPPFSSDVRTGAKNNLIGAEHITQALKMLAPGGRLVAIVGGGINKAGEPKGGMSFGSSTYREWWDQTGKDFAIRANIWVDGKVYRKMGTSFDTRIIVIDRATPDPNWRMNAIQSEVDNITSLTDILYGVRNARSGNFNQPVQSGTGPGLHSDAQGSESGTLPQPSNVPGRPSDGAPGVDLGGDGPGQRPKRPVGEGTGRNPVPERKPDVSTEADNPVGGRDNGGNRRPVNESPARGKGDGAPDPGDMGDRVRTGLAEPKAEGAKVADIDLADEIGDGTFSGYRVERLDIPGAQPHPAKLVQTSAMAAAPLPIPAIKQLNIPDRWVKDGELSGPQLEAALYAVNAMTKKIRLIVPGENNTPMEIEANQGFLIGDGTGVGKTREILGVIAHHWNSGTKKIVVMSKASLLADLKTEMNRMGLEIPVSDVASKKPIAEEGILFVSYGVIGSEKTIKNTGMTQRQKAENWMWEGFDGVIVLDEAHTVSNALPIEKVSGQRRMIQKPAQTAAAVLSVTRKYPNAKVLYASATVASEANQLGFAERLGLWGPGSPFSTFRDFLKSVTSGGLGAMELVARGLKQRGAYIARNISFEGVEQQTVTHNLTEDQISVFNQVSEAWGIVLNNLNEAMSITHIDKNAKGKGAALSAFYGSMQQFYNAYLTGLMVPTLIKNLEDDLAAGMAPVIQLTQTNKAKEDRARAERAAREAELEEGEEPEPLDTTPKSVLLDYLNRSFPTQLYVQEADGFTEDGRPIIKWVAAVDEKGTPIQDPDAVAKKQEALASIANLYVPDAAINQIFNHFGSDVVGEVTGRDKRVVRGVEERVHREAEAFMSGKKKILIFSKAGGTGASFHADKRVENQARRVHYLLQAGWSAAEAIQGLGRTHRANQIQPPIVKLMTTNVKGHARFISTIARRIAQLGALTQGERSASGSGVFKASDNLESTEARAAMNEFLTRVSKGKAKSLTLNEAQGMMGLKLVDERTGAPLAAVPPTTQVLNRLLALPFEKQNEVFDEFMGLVEGITDAAIANGTLDTGTQKLEGDNHQIMESHQIEGEPGVGPAYQVISSELPVKLRRFGLWERNQGFSGWWQDPQGRIVEIKDLPETDTASGRVRVNHLLAYPSGEMKSTVKHLESEGYARIRDREEAKVRWEAALESAPKTRTTITHLLTGDILSIWNRLPESQHSIQVVKGKLADGKPILGRVVPQEALAGTLEALGVESNYQSTMLKQMTPAQLFQAVLAGAKVSLPRGFTLRSMRFQGNPRIIMDGPWTDVQAKRNAQASYGLMLESRPGSFMLDAFVPTGGAGPAVLEKLLKDYPPVKAEGLEAAISKAGINILAGHRPENRGQAGFIDIGGIAQAVKDVAGWAKDKITEAKEDWTTSLTQEQKEALEHVGGIVHHPPLSDRLKAWYRDAFRVQKWIDQFDPIDKLDQHAYMLSRLSKGSDGAVEALMLFGNLSLEDGVTNADAKGRGFIEVMQDLQGEQDRFMWWVAARRAEHLTEEGRENLFRDTDIEELRKLNQGEMPDGQNRAAVYLKVLKQYNAISKSVLDLCEESGTIDPESRSMWEQEFYVPFFRAMEDGVSGPNIAAGGGLVRQYAFKRLRGGKEKLNNDLLHNVLMNWSHLVSSAAKNRAAVATLRAAEEAGIAERVTSEEKGAVWCLEEGKRVYYRVDDPYMLEAILALESTGMNGDFMKIASKFKRIMTVGVTANPAFKVRNLIRDSVASVAISRIGANPLTNVATGTRIMSQKKSQDYASILASGAIIRFGTMLEGDTSKHVQKLINAGVDANTIVTSWEHAKDAIQKVWDGYNELGDISEGANRAALYKQLRDRGSSHADAAFQARDLLDFTMGGTGATVRFLTSVVPFMNARIQGLYKLGRASQENPARFWATLSAVALASIALMLKYRDDEDWKKREDWDRDNFWWFKVGGKAFRIPKPFEVGAIGTLAERSVELYVSDEMTKERFLKRLGAMVYDTFAMNPTPQIARPVLDIYANKDPFTGRPIETMGMENLSKADRYNENTSEVGKVVGKSGVLSPAQVDYLVRGYLGWLGTAALTASSEIARPMTEDAARPSRKLSDTFFVGNFVESLPSGRSRYVTSFYDQAAEIEKAYASFRSKVKQGDMPELDAKTKTAIQGQKVVGAGKDLLSRIHQAEQRVMADKTMTSAQKRAKLDELERLRQRVAKNAEARLKQK